MHKIVREQKSGWWVAHEDLGVTEIYLGSYKTKESAEKSHPNADFKYLEEN